MRANITIPEISFNTQNSSSVRLSTQGSISVFTILLFFFTTAVPPLSGPWPLIQFRNHFSTDGRTPWTSDHPVARPLSKHTTQTQNKRIHTPNIHALSGIRTHDPSVRASEDSSCLRPRGYRDRLASERAKAVHALDRAAAVTGLQYCYEKISLYDMLVEPSAIFFFS
jgi:hypothetical protein